MAQPQSKPLTCEANDVLIHEIFEHLHLMHVYHVSQLLGVRRVWTPTIFDVFQQGEGNNKPRFLSILRNFKVKPQLMFLLELMVTYTREYLRHVEGKLDLSVVNTQ